VILTPPELEAFTRKTQRAQKRYGSQAKVLDSMRIPYTKRPDKTLIVYRCFVEPNGQTPKTAAPAPALVFP
jgi:ribosomal protein L44E